VKRTRVEICAEKPTVNKIIEAAVPLFAIKGLAAVSVKELADAAGVNIALISYYFGGKDNLYAFVLEKQLSRFVEAIEIINQEEISAVMKIRRFANILIVAHKESPYLDRLFFTEIFSPTKYFDLIVKTAAQRLHLFLQNCIKDAVANGEFRSDIEPEFAAISLMKILHLSFTSQTLCKELLPDKEDIAEQYMSHALEIYLHGVTK
jgi:AcrR family transcriptional regulator